MRLFFAFKIGGKVILLCHNWLTQRRIRHLKKLRIHRKYVISLIDVPESLAGAKRCISSAKRYGEDQGMEIFPGVRKEDSLAFFLEHNLTFSSIPGHEKHRGIAAEMGCFASHYLLWEKCIELNEPIIILEHDVEFRAPISPLRFEEIIHLGKPHIQRDVEISAAIPSKYQEAYYPFNYLLGTYAYGITPAGAHKLVNAAHKTVVSATDSFIDSRRNNILFYLPHPITTRIEWSYVLEAPHRS